MNKIDPRIVAGLIQHQSNVVEQLGLRKYFLDVREHGAKGDGVQDDFAAFQTLAAKCDVEKASHFFVNTMTGDYIVSSAIVFKEPGLKFFGLKGVSYDRGLKKNGFIVGGGSDNFILDLGGGRREKSQGGDSNNPADTWSVSNIGFKQAANTIPFSKHGVALTSQTNGPDRGVYFNEVSMVGLKSGVYVPLNAPDVSIQVANLIIENSVLSMNRYGVLVDGQVYGLRFVGNQAEQNIESAIKGPISGGIVISDNMLEGQKNPICITGSLADVKLVSERNYFERNDVDGSDYVYMLGAYYYYSRNYAKIGPNFTSGVETPPDIVRLTGSGSWHFEINDNVPLTLFECSASVVKGSKIFNAGIDHYRIRSLKESPSSVIYIDDGINMLDVDNSHTQVKFTSGAQRMTPFGLKYIRTAADKISIPVAATSGDLIVMNVLMRSKKNSLGQTGKSIFIYNTTDVYVDNGYPTGLMDCSSGEWVLVSIPWHCQGNLSGGFKLGFDQIADEVIEIAGIAVKNYGKFQNDNLSVVKINPVCPIV